MARLAPEVSAVAFIVPLWSAKLHAGVTGGLTDGGACQGVRARAGVR